MDPVGGFAEVSSHPGRFDRIDTVIRWRVPGSNQIAPIDIEAVFERLKA